MFNKKSTSGVFLGLVAASSGWMQAESPSKPVPVSVLAVPAAVPEQSAVVPAPGIQIPGVPPGGSIAIAPAIAPAPSVQSPLASPSLSPTTSPSASAAVPHRPGGEPGWVHGVIRTGEDRDAIKSLPMTERPYRPLHFYGNTVRRMHYRGTALPAPRDVVGAGAATILRK